MSDFELLSDEIVYEGRIATVHRERFRHADGEEVTRERVAHPGAVAIVAHDGEHVFLIRQPREAVRKPDLLELPAGKLDEEGETPLETARRELEEEIGKAAERWRELKAFWSSPGFSDERIWIFLAEGLTDLDEPAEADENERIELVPWPLDRLDEAIAECEDAKSLIGLLLLKEEHDRSSRVPT
jgi:8-oxo-dGTP pyrophosphatase MutT (NUDIX family)